jgi:Mg-chelatase subunit ChlD
MSTPTNDTLTLTTASETKACVFNKEVTVTFNANIKAPLMDSDEHDSRKSVDIVCVIDKSGSMSGEPMKLVKETLMFMVSQLKDGDKLSVVTFGDDAYLEFSLTEMNDAGKVLASSKIQAMATDGWTHLSGGIMKGLEELSKRPSSSASSVSSVLVFTDGQANRGVTNAEELVKAVVSKLDGIQGAVSLHTFGFSQNHNPELLTKIAEAANGVFYYLTNVERIPEVFADCLGGLLSVVAMNVILEATVEYTGATIVNVHTPFAVRQLTQGTHVSITLGQMYSEQSRDVLFDVKLPAVDASDLDAKALKFKLTNLNRQEQTIDASAFATIDRTTEESPAIKEVNEEVVKQKARVVTASAMRQALEYKAAGRMDRAQETLSTAKTSMQSAGFGGYAAQLDTAGTEISSSNTGYLWTNLRSHAAQSSSAAAPPTAPYGAAPVELEGGYSNSVQRKMKSAAPRQQQAPANAYASVSVSISAPAPAPAPPQQQPVQPPQIPINIAPSA